MIFVADNLTITDPRFQKALIEMDPEFFREQVCRFEKSGADAIDLNIGPLSRQSEQYMEFAVRTVQDASDLPVLIDTANPEAMKAGLSANRKKAVINGFSLEPKKLKKILPLSKDFDADIIGYLLHPDSRVPADADSRLSIAVEVYAQTQKAGIHPERLIIDPVIVPLTWDTGKQQARAVLSTLRQLPEVLGFPVRTIAGISNLTAGQGEPVQKRYFEEMYAVLLAEAGLTMALLNIFHERTIKIARAGSALADDRIFSWMDQIDPALEKFVYVRDNRY
jgi:5-methyltetrahydrofolate corrinoid/iron sulfur protein methyltransferase